MPGRFVKGGLKGLRSCYTFSMKLHPVRPKQKFGLEAVMSAEELQAYQLHVKSFADEYSPKGATEASLVQALADASWRLHRVRDMANLDAHKRRLSSQITSTVRQIRTLQAERQKKEKDHIDRLLNSVDMKGGTRKPS